MQNLEIEFAYSYIFSAAHRCVSAKKKNNGGVNTPNGACYQNI